MSDADVNFADMGSLAAPMLAADDLALAAKDMSDRGNAERFIVRHGDRFVYVRGQGWHVYDGMRWASDGAEARALLAAAKTAEAIDLESRACFEAAKRDVQRASALTERGHKLKDWMTASGALARCVGMLKFAAAKLERDFSDFDADAFALNVQNGTLRFVKFGGSKPGDYGPRATVRLDPHDPRDLITRVSSFKWNAKAHSAPWKAHLDRCVPDGREQRFLSRIMGYCALGLIREQCFFMFQGRGGDGKSVTVNTVRRVLGGYSSNADVKTFLEDKTGRSGAAASPDLARLAGACRLVSTSEPPRGSRLNEAMIKQITGGSPLVARHLNRDAFEFEPRFKLLLECNARPAIGGGDDGIWRRVILMPWRVQLKRSEMDPGIEDKLVRDGEAVLAWLVSGVLSYLDRGLDQPETIEAAHADYKRGSSLFREWLDLHVEMKDDAVELMSKLYGSFKEWMEGQGQEPMAQKSFGLALSEHQIMITAREPGTGKGRRRGARLLESLEVSARLAAADVPLDACVKNIADASQNPVMSAADGDVDAEARHDEGD